MKIAIAGATGRMGQAVQNIIERQGGDTHLAGLLSRKTARSEIELILDNAEAIIDFSTPLVSTALAMSAAAHGIVHVIGTTGFSAKEEQSIARSAKKAVIIKSGNMSLGVNLIAALAKQAAEKLGAEFDIEILDIHHRNKLDAPSGTALLLGEAAAKGRGEKLTALTSRNGKRKSGIGFASLRTGGVIGEHDVSFASNSEIVTLSHKALDRSLFAEGALKAAMWGKIKLKKKQFGLYSMQDVLGLSS
ncbi:MAG: 4-hydroxy-tetrahydrodipicolinate reductase [Pseudomonadota bacterium]